VDIDLRYGPGTLRFRVPEANVAGVFRPVPPAGAADSPLRKLSAGAEAERVRADARGRRVLFLIADATRDEPHGDILEAGFALLGGAASVTVGVTCGSHKADTPGNRRIAEAAVQAARKHGLRDPDVVIHDCRAARFTDHGTTSRGNRVLLSDVLDSAEALLVASDMKHHYFAGYSNALKDFLPGIAAFESIERNHRFALEPDATFGRHPLHPDPKRRTNPVAEDMLEAWNLAVRGRPCHAMVTVTLDGSVAHAHLGTLREATSSGMTVVDEIASFSVAPTRHLVLSAGGAPQDETLYLSQRAVELTRAAIADGAEVLLLAECPEGIADSKSAYENFYLELTRPLGEVMQRIRGGYKLYQHKAYKFAELLQRIDALHLHSRLPDEEVRAAHLNPVRDPQRVVDSWIARDPSCRIAFFDEANRLCVLPA
jgi:nickel-dependent lactate racemase